MRTRIHFLPAGQIENLGDQLINLATINAIRPYGEIVINDLRTPGWFIDAIATAGDRRFSELSQGRFFANLAALLLRQKFSGERLQHYLVLPPGHSSRKGLRQARDIFKWYARLLLLSLLGCKVVRAGFSIGPFDRINGWVESLGSRAFDFYGVRDRESFELANSFGCSNLHYFPDLAWSYLPRQRRLPAPESGPVVVSFRSNAYGTIHRAEYLRPVRERLRLLLSSCALSGKRIVVAYQVQSDHEPSVELFEDLRAQGLSVELHQTRLSIDEAASLYADACCVISNRLHVLLLAAQSGTLPIPLADMKDNVKITSILNDNGLADIIINLEEDEVASVARIDSILRARDDILERFVLAHEKNAKCIERGFASVFRSG